MKRTSAILVFFVPLTALASDGILATGSHSSSGGISMSYITRAEPPTDRYHFGGGFRFDQNGLHRVEIDSSTRTFFGYDMLMERIADTRQCRVTIQALSLTAADIASWYRGAFDLSYRTVMLPQYPPPQTIDSGDTVALDLLASPDGRQKVVDYLTVACVGGNQQRAAISRRGPLSSSASHSRQSGPASRDITLDDVMMRLRSASLSVNGGPVAGHVQAGDTAGAILWFAVPGKGRFLVSLTPRANHHFVKTGVIRGRTLGFSLDGDQYEVQSVSPILGGYSAINIYILRDRSYQSRQGRQFGAGDTVEEILSER
jgi:hypothetical protein